MVDDDTIRRATGNLDFFGRQLRGVANAGVGLAGELLNANQKLSDYSGALVNNTGLLDKFGAVINGLTKFAEDSLEEYQTLTGIGASFGKEMSQIKISAAELGLNVKDMTDLFMKNNDALRAFGGTTDTAIQNFTRLSKSLLDSQFGTEMRRLGFTAADVNETLLIYNELAQQDGLNRTRSTQQQVEGARNFAVELDGLAKLTGKQRSELADEMKARRREGKVQAFLMGQSAEAQEAFMLATQEIKETMGPQFETLFQDLLIRGAPITEESRNAFLALGGSADEFEASVANFKRGMQTNDFDNFNSSLTNAQGAFLENLKTDEARSIAMLSDTNNFSDAMARAFETSNNFANAMDAAAEDDESQAQTIRRIQEQISQEQLTQMATTGNLLDKTVQMQEAVREFTIAATGTLKNLENVAIQGIDMFLERLPSAEQLAEQLSAGVNSLFSNLDERMGDSYVRQTTDTFTEIIDPIAAAAAANGAAILEANTARESAEAALSNAQATLADLTAQGFDRMDPAIRQARERVEQAEDTLLTAIEEGNRQIAQAQAEAFTRSQISQFQNSQETGRRFAGVFAEGGSIGNNEFGLVGEAGIEFVNGPANVTSARDSMSVMQNLLKSIKTLDENVQSQAQDTAIAISNTRDDSNMEKKYDTMIGLLAQLVNVEVDASNTAQRTYRATKGLQGNMIRGLGV